MKKVADRLGPKGDAGGSRGLTSSARGPHASRSTCRCLRSHTPEAETSKPRILASTGEGPIFPPHSFSGRNRQGGPGSFRFVRARMGKQIASDARGGAGVGSWKKRMPACNGSDTGSEFARRESEQTSRRCLSAKKCMRTILDRESDGKRRLQSTVYEPSPSTKSELDGSTRVSRSTFKRPENIPARGLDVRVGVSRLLRCLSPVLGNWHAGFLEGCGGGNAPVPTRRLTESEWSE